MSLCSSSENFILMHSIDISLIFQIKIGELSESKNIQDL